MQYKQAFSRLYPIEALGGGRLDEALAFLDDGKLLVELGDAPEVIDLGVQDAGESILVMAGDQPFQAAETPDARYSVEVHAIPHQGSMEYWLIQTNRAHNTYKRTHLNSKWDAHLAREPRVVASPGSGFFMVDDGGTLRLYNAADLAQVGTFQVANAYSGNQIVALAVSADDRYIAALSRWKDIVLYDVTERQVAFVRHIADGVGWYGSEAAQLLIAQNAATLVTAGISESQISVNIFESIAVSASV
jgi:hypothetical protein